jgi:hypothetical protein
MTLWAKTGLQLKYTRMMGGVPETFKRVRKSFSFSTDVVYLPEYGK